MRQSSKPPAPRRPPRDELVNVLEFEEVAQQLLPGEVYTTIAGGDRRAFERMIFRPRMLIPTVDLDLSVELFGQSHFTPILVGPVADQRRYHPGAELATVRGAAAAKAAVVISSRSSVPIAQLAAQAKTPLWVSVYASDASASTQAQQAVADGGKVVCITVGATLEGSRVARSRVDWKAVDQIRRGLDVPVVVKGVMTAADAKSAVAQGAAGLIVSDHGAAAAAGGAPIEAVAPIVDAVGGTAVVLVDGSVRRGTDVLKALILGARGVLVARPAMWGLASYGADGVQSVIELLQSSLGRNMAMLGVSNVKGLTRAMMKIWPPT